MREGAGAEGEDAYGHVRGGERRGQDLLDIKHLDGPNLKSPTSSNKAHHRQRDPNQVRWDPFDRYIHRHPWVRGHHAAREEFLLHRYIAHVSSFFSDVPFSCRH